ncbi:hypothetical protein FIE12Z_10834 [Fusarium flagelliforme]|uniref:Uncharacterized protein n=1 Tax=Fusarium flagelliforme TaxID=2675880 RepID=A0A395MCV2_9HYPO|nr:hypothetical protein FIE12Z_10834 [Fusarium flagelliforme]
MASTHPSTLHARTFEAQDGRGQSISDAHIHHPLLTANDPNPLSSRYLSLVCNISSGFDSPDNPFRTLVAELMFSYPQFPFRTELSLRPPSNKSIPFSSQHTYFFAGIIAYLESTTTFHMDQELSTTDYLLPLSDCVKSRGGHPNLLSGIVPTLFTYMAKTACIVRKHYIKRSASTDYEQSPSSVLLKSARQVQQKVLSYKMPPSNASSETYDNLTLPKKKNLFLREIGVKVIYTE